MGIGCKIKKKSDDNEIALSLLKFIKQVCNGKNINFCFKKKNSYKSGESFVVEIWRFYQIKIYIWYKLRNKDLII